MAVNPLPFLVSGVVSGSVYGLTAMGLVVSYKVSRVINFAYGAIAMFCAYCYWQLRVEWSFPLPLALLGGVVIVPTVLALATEGLVYRRLSSSSVFARTAASVGLLVAFYGVTLYLWNGPLVNQQLVFPRLFPSGLISLPGVKVSGQQIGIFVVVLLIAGLLYLVLRFSSVGVQLRAVVVSRELAEFRGINSLRITKLAWIGSYVLAAVSGVLVAPLTDGQPETLTLIVIFSLAAAVLGGFLSLPLALSGGLMLGLAYELLPAYAPSDIFFDDVRYALPFIFLFLALIFQTRRLSSGHDSAGRASILEDLGSAAGRRSPAVGHLTGSVLVVLGAGAAFRLAGSSFYVLLLSTGVGLSLILLSYRVFTATTGMVSLAQAAFAGLGAFTAADLKVSAGWPWAVAVGGGALVAAAAGVLVALPTVRLRGVFLALATLAFAQFVNQVVFTNQGFTASNGGFGKTFPRPEVFKSDFAYLVLLLGAFWVLGYLGERFQYSRTGLDLQADLASGPGARSIGIRPELGRLMAFSLSAAIAAVGGALMAAQIGAVSVNTYDIIPALLWLTLVASGGLGSTPMMLQMGLVYSLVPALIFVHFPQYTGSSVAIFGVLALALLRVPGGLAAMQDRQVRAILRRASQLRGSMRRPSLPSESTPSSRIQHSEETQLAR